jgi:hypothetical protein
MTESSKPQVDWFIVEKEYRAGIRPLRDIAADAGITEGAIRKRAKRDGWSRDLQAKIQAKAEEKVRKEAVRTVSTQLTPADERTVIEVNAEVIAQADLLNREDVMRGISVSRNMLDELDALSDPRFRERLEWLGEEMRAPNSAGIDKLNDLYKYIVDLSGRVKMAKDIAASLGVYIPMQRKILKLDAEASGNQAAVDEILRRINAEA